MNASIYRINLDMHRVESQAMLNIKQGDNARHLIFSLSDGGKPYVIPNNCRAVLRARKKPDENILFNDCAIKSDNTITYDVTSQTTAAEGIVECELTLYGEDGKVITTPYFTMRIDEHTVTDGEIESTDEFTALNRALAAVDNLDITAEKTGNVTTVTVTHKDGTKQEATVSDGEKGEAFKYSDFTPEQLAGLKGPKGDTGNQGYQGRSIAGASLQQNGHLNLTFHNPATGQTTTQDIGNIMGNTGPQGQQGPQGAKGDKGDKGDPGSQGPQGIQGESGPKGDKGAKGDKGDPGDASALNIENGEGDHSLQQKTATNDEPYEQPKALGKWSTAEGRGNNFEVYAISMSGGTIRVEGQEAYKIKPNAILWITDINGNGAWYCVTATNGETRPVLTLDCLSRIIMNGDGEIIRTHYVSDIDMSVPVKVYMGAAASSGTHIEGCFNNGVWLHSDTELNEENVSRQHAEGTRNLVTGFAGHGEGGENLVNGNYAHAQNRGNEANGNNTDVAGYYNKANYSNQSVVGKYNDNKEGNLFEVGNGTENNRSNAFEVDSSGKAVVSGFLDNKQSFLKINNKPLNMGKIMGSDYQQDNYIIDKKVEAGFWQLEFNYPVSDNDVVACGQMLVIPYINANSRPFSAQILFSNGDDSRNKNNFYYRTCNNLKSGTQIPNWNPWVKVTPGDYVKNNTNSLTNYYTKSETDNLLDTKQDALTAYELIETYTLTAERHTFERAIDRKGNNYSFQKIIAVIDFPDIITADKQIDFYTDFAGGHLAADAITGTSYSGNRLLIFTYTGTNTAPHGRIVAKAIIENDILNFEISSAAFTSMANVAWNNCIYKSAYLVKANGKKLNIVGFHFGKSESDVFPIGTKFDIYGVK